MRRYLELENDGRCFMEFGYFILMAKAKCLHEKDIETFQTHNKGNMHLLTCTYV
jgi:hypothetical protein